MPAATAVNSFELLFVIPETVAFGENKFVVDDDANADARRIPVLQRLGHVGVEPVECLRDIDTLRGGAPGECEEEQTGSG